MSARLKGNELMLKLKQLTVEKARFIALLAKAARMQRDTFLGKVPENNLDGVSPARGEHNPTAELGFEPLPANSQVAALREAIVSLALAARAELFALIRIGQGHLAAATAHQGVVEAELLGDEAVVTAIATILTCTTISPRAFMRRSSTRPCGRI